MPAFTLYTSRGSSNADRVRLTLAEGGFTDFDTVMLDLAKSEQKSPENSKRHPWGKVPSVEFADGFTIYESRVICKYLANKYNFPLLPAESDFEATALFDQAQSVETSYFADPAGKIGFELVAKKRMGLPPNESVVAEALKGLETFLDVAEKLLEQNDYAAGKHFTLVDIYYIPLLQRLFVCGYGEAITKRKAVNTWWQRIVNRPAIAQLLKSDRDAMVAMAATR